MKVFLLFCTIQDIKPHIKQLGQWKQIMHLEGSMVIYDIYNTETLEKMIDTVHHTLNITIPNEKLFTGELNTAYM